MLFLPESISMSRTLRAFLRIAILTLLVVTITQGQGASGGSAPGSITVRSEDRQSILSPADLAKAARHEYRIAAEGSKDSVTVSGVSLWDILQLAGMPSPEASGRQRGVMFVRIAGADGQNAVFALAELDPTFTHRIVLVADRRSGQPLDAAEGPWRVFAPDDLRHARWIRGLVMIELVTLKP